MKQRLPLTLGTTIFILGIFCIGFFLRAQETISGNFLFLLDSGRDMMDVSLGGVFQGPLYYYLLAIPTALFEGNPWGNIFLMLVLSMLVLTVVFYGMNKYFGFIPAVITLVLFAFSPEAVAAATYFWNPHPMWIILVMYIFSLYGALNNNSRAQLVLWPIIASSFHFQMAFGFFLFIATWVYIVLFHRGMFTKNKNMWFGLLLAGLFFLPQVLFEFRHNFLMTRSVIDVFQGSARGLITSGEQGDAFSVLVNNYRTLRHNFISSFIHEKQFRYIPMILSLFSIAALSYGAISKKFSTHEKRFMHMAVSIIIIIWSLGLIYPYPLRYWFLTGFQSFYLVLMGIMLSKLYTVVIGRLSLFIVFTLLLSYAIFRLNVLYFNPPDDGGFAKIKGKIQAIDYIYQDAEEHNFGVMVFTPPVLTDAYDYLFWWHGRRRYGYIPYNEKKGTVYLLIEPDPGNPWSYNGWLETVIKTGIVESTETLPSGIIIQKRLM